MTKTIFTYAELQGLAKENGVHANQSAERLFNMLTMLGVITDGKIEQVEEQPTQQHNPFAGFFTDKRSQKQQASVDVKASFQGNNYVSPGLMKLAKDLYALHKLNPDMLDTMTWQQVKAEVDKLNALPRPMSPKQEEALFKVLEELKELGVPVDVPKEVLSQLTGGVDGSASQLIEALFQKRFEAQQNAPLSDAQAETIMTWFLCPDIPFEDFNIGKKVMLPELGEKTWRFMTCEEFVNELKAKLTRSQASKFIDDYRANYYEWKKTRCSAQQKQYIRQLEERMADISSPTKVEYAIVDGMVQQVVKRQPKAYNPQAYQPMSDFDLEQMSYEDASRFIDQLKSELGKPKQSSFVMDTAQQDLESKVQKFSDNTGTGSANDQMTAKLLEHRKLSDIIFQLEAVAGHQVEELHESVHNLMVRNEGNPLDVANDLRDFMDFILDKGYIKFENLVQMVEPSQVATNILQVVYPEQYNQAIGGKTDKPMEEEVQPQAKEDTTVTDFIKNL